MPTANKATLNTAAPEIPQKTGVCLSKNETCTVGVGLGITTVGVRLGVAVGVTGVGVEVAVGGAGVGVIVAGGVTCNSSFWSGSRIEELFNPFQPIRSFTLILYRSAIHDSVSPLRTR